MASSTTTDRIQPGVTYLLAGNTYPHRQTIRDMGGDWDAASKTWTVETSRQVKVFARERIALLSMESDGVEIVAAK